MADLPTRSAGLTIRCLAAVLFALAWHGSLLAQDKAPAAPASPAPATEAAAEPAAPQAIAVADIAQQAEAATAAIRQIENNPRIAEALTAASVGIPRLERETAYWLRQLRLLDPYAFSLETIQGIDEELRDILARTSPLLRDLTRAALEADRDLQELGRLDGIWAATVTAATGSAAPPDVVGRARDLNGAIAQARKTLLEDRAQLLALQGRATDIGAQLGEIRQLLATAGERAVTRLFYRDSPPLWNTAFWRALSEKFSDRTGTHIGNQASALTDYVRERPGNFALHGLFFLALSAALAAARARVAVLSQADDGLLAGQKVFDMPFVTALLLAMLCSGWFYPDPPRALWLAIGILSTVPLLVFARRVIGEHIYPVLYAIVVFYLADKARALFAPLPGAHRILLLLEVLALLLFAAATLRRSRNSAAAPEDARAWRLIGKACWLVLGLALAILAAGIGGYARLADLVMRAALSSAYTAAVLYAIAHAAEGLIYGMLYLPPLSFLAGVQRHRALIAARFNKWVKWLAFALWAALTLQAPGLLQQLVELMRSVWNYSFKIGNVAFVVSEIAMFFLILWAAWVLSRMLRFLLEEEIFSRMRLDRGLPHAVSTTVHYAILLSGLVLALAAIGVDMTKFTIVAGALTVGIGFGLQNIVNNFVSGLIVLFERPVKIGDTIQIDNVIGRVQHIGIRATIIQSTEGAQIIMPNGKLISDKVTNWTLSSQLQQVSVPVITKPDVNVGQLKAMLAEVARGNRQVLEKPSPEVLFIKRGVDTYEFELRVWTSDLEGWLKVKSDLITAINEALENRRIAGEAAAAQLSGAIPSPPAS